MSEIKKCWYCGETIADEKDVFEIDTQDSGPLQYWHVACAEKTGMKKSKKLEKLDKMLEEIKTHGANTSSFNTTALEALRIFSCINLAIGILGAIIIWATTATIEVPYYSFSGTHTETNPVGIALGFVALFEGILGYILLQVICSMADSIISIKKKLFV